jgi:3-phenylpropionate/cinnamic acid dioxygenase small subunit
MEGKQMQMSEIEDRFKIHDLFARYMRSVDNWDEAELFACFTEDGVLETPILGGRFAGREGQRQFVEKGRKNGAGRQTRHLFTNLEVEIDGDRAHARAYLVVNSSKDGQTTIFGTGHYDCRLKKLDGRWLFAERKVFIDGKP